MRTRLSRTGAHPDETGAWLAQLHDDDRTSGPGEIRPADGIPLQPQATLPRPYVGAAAPGRVAQPQQPTPAGGAGAAPAAPGGPSWPGRGADQVTVRAVIGDELRKPVLWCQMGSCIASFAHPDALGEADNRARAIDAGWREDAFARFACPACLQTSTIFRSRYPVVPWDVKHAIAMATLMTVTAVPRPRGEPPRDRF